MPFTSSFPISYSSRTSWQALTLWHFVNANSNSRFTPRKPVWQQRHTNFLFNVYFILHCLAECANNNRIVKIQKKSIRKKTMKSISIPSLNWLAFTLRLAVISFMRCKSFSICGKVSTNVASCVNETAFDFSFSWVITTSAVSVQKKRMEKMRLQWIQIVK